MTWGVPLRFLRMQTFVVVMLGLLGAAHTLLAQRASGTWEARVQLDAGRGEPTFVCEQDGDEGPIRARSAQPR